MGLLPPFEVGDLSAHPFAARFDLVTSFNCLHWVPTDRIYPLLCGAEAGKSLIMSPAMGNGFKIEEMAVPDSAPAAVRRRLPRLLDYRDIFRPR